MPRLDKDVHRFRASCFALVPLAQLRLLRKVRRQNLDGDDSIEARVTRAVHFTHPARSNQGKSFVRAQTLTWEDRHGVPD